MSKKELVAGLKDLRDLLMQGDFAPQKYGEYIVGYADGTMIAVDDTGDAQGLDTEYADDYKRFYKQIKLTGITYVAYYGGDAQCKWGAEF